MEEKNREVGWKIKGELGVAGYGRGMKRVKRGERESEGQM